MAPSRRQVLVTWGLLFVWAVLMSFGIVSLTDPDWLQELARPGVEAEARAYKDYGDAALREHNYERAVRAYSRSLEIKPDQVRVLPGLGLAFMLAGNLRRANEILESALRMESSRFNRAAIYYNLAELRERQGRLPEAIEYCRQALESGAEQDKVYRKLGTLYYKAKEYESALKAFEKTLASQLDPCRSYRNMLYRSLDSYENEATCLAIIEEQLAGNTTSADLGRFDLEIIQQLQQGDQDIAKTRNYLADICGRLGRIAEARAHCQESLRIWPDNPAATEMLTLLRSLQDRQSE